MDKIKKVDKCMFSRLCIFVLSHSKKIMNNYVHEIGGSYSPKMYYQDTDSLYSHMNHYAKIKRSCLNISN